jgi:uncharacterized protein YbjT (DUF2867 family)
MKLIAKIALVCALGLVALTVAFDIWGFATLGKITPDVDAAINEDANKVVMVFGATGSVGDGLLKAAVEDPDVEKVYVVTRRISSRITAAEDSGKVEVRLHEDFTDYSDLADTLREVNTVLWGLGTTSIGMDDSTYTLIHVDFPLAFVTAWLAARTAAPMSFHYVTGMGTDPEGDQHWAREKGRAELELANLAEGTGLRTFSYRSAFVRPTSEQANAFHYLLEALLKPGALVITAKDLGGAMLEISARTTELENGMLIDNADSIVYAAQYKKRVGAR